MNYGIPYQGSKSKIIKEIIKTFPCADNFYDLFGGGFSVTHAMLLHRRLDFKNFYFNEIRPGITTLIQGALKCEYSYRKFKPNFISRDMFFNPNCKNDAYIKIVWSFGNNWRSYLFSEDIESYKKSIHNAVVFNEFDELASKVLGFDKFRNLESIKDRRLHLRNRIENFRKTKIPKFLHKYLNEKQLEQIERLEQLERIEELQRLQQLQQLEQLERLQQLQQLENIQKTNPVNLTFYNLDYRKVEIKENSIVYCDIPYKSTTSYYGKNFNHDEFFDWAHGLKMQVFISEFNIDDKRFCKIAKIKKRSLMRGSLTKVHPDEKIYCNQSGYKAFRIHCLRKKAIT